MSGKHDKTLNPVSSPDAQSGKGRPEGEPGLEELNPSTENIDKVLTPTSIKEKESQAEAIRSKNAEAESALRKNR